MGRALTILAAGAVSLILFVFPASGVSSPGDAARPLSRLVRELIAAPDSPVLHFELGEAYFRGGVLPQAEKEYLAALRLGGASLGPGPLKSYLRAVRSQRSLSAEEARLMDLHRMTPQDPEAALWLIDVHLEKGDAAAARALLNAFPQFRRNEDILSKWVGVSGARPPPGASDQPAIDERFTDLTTLLQVGSPAHQTGAARQIMGLAATSAPAVLAPAHRRAVQTSFDILKTVLAETEQYQLHQDYLDVLELWKSSSQALDVMSVMRRKFPALASDPEFLYRLARMQSAAGKPVDALTSVQESFRRGLDLATARLFLADLLDRKGSVAEAIEEYVKSLEGLMPAPDRIHAMTRIEKWLPSAAAASVTLLERIARVMPQSVSAQVLLASRLESSGKIEESYGLYLAAFKLDPQSPTVLAGLARTLIRMERWYEADETLRKMGADPILALWGRAPVYVVGRRLFELGETATVRRTIDAAQAGRGSPGGEMTADQIALAADLALSDRRMSDVIRLYLRLKRFRPLHQEETHKLIFAQRKFSASLKKEDRIPEEVPPVPAPPPGAVEEQLSWIRANIASGDFSSAARMLEILESVLSAGPGPVVPEANSLLGRIELALGNKSAARAAFGRALAQNPRDAAAALGLAGLLRDEKDPAGAVQILSDLEPKPSNVMRALSDLYASLGQWGMAAAWQEKSAGDRSDKIRAAWYWFRAGQYEEASRFVPPGGLFEAVLEAESGRPEKLERRSETLLKKIVGEPLRPEGGKDRPMDRWTRSVLDAARSRLESGDLEAAVGLCDSILRRIAHPEGLYLKAVAFLRLGFYDEAEIALDRVTADTAWSVSAHLRLGQLELIRGRPAEALRHLDRAGPGTDPGELILAWGMALARTKSPEQGEQILRQAARRGDRGKFFLARFLEEQGRSQESRDLYAAIVTPPYRDFSRERREKLDKPPGLR
ncbi:tetratricopeptide repeat protein [bacterium]|nr:tetratricopeptide repeat protein [bacterium]